MKLLTQNIIKYSLLTIIFVASSYAYAAWTEPTGTPPSNNVDAPINIASTSQTKGGFLWTGGFGSTAGGYFTTTLGVATTTDPATKSLVALFGGKTGATQYCDGTGATCNNPTTPQTVYFPTGPLRLTDYYDFTATMAYSNAPAIVHTISIPKSALVAASSLAAAETRDIAGIIVGFDLGITTSANHADIRDKWYVVSINNADDPLNWYAGNIVTDTIYYDYNAYSVTAPTSGHVTIIDVDNNDYFEIETWIARATIADLVNGTQLRGHLVVLGYITR